jgi:hypothetical protein
LVRADIKAGLDSGSAGSLNIQAMKQRGRERLAANAKVKK